ncbi:Muscle M-line assembly protein unc-89 [Chionoecetes opilio]|uniref:Muscle M-line assembly protein unc-89 n=1 Tax=Chionoecetes opilio TaxID=41210 RepID=A0A8J5D3H3_CHIOP|nr:Muscle M-line assembly protein unc-89 [Chionoecetes opilio]
MSADWLELRVVELTPGMVYLGSNLREATQLLQAHEEVLAKLQATNRGVPLLLLLTEEVVVVVVVVIEVVMVVVVEVVVVVVVVEESKQSPVEDLLNQADQLISTQHPRAEVYAAMAESLGLAWKGLNAQLETRKEILEMGVAFHTKAQHYSDSMDAAERAYTDNVMPNDAEGARQLLNLLHDHKRTVLEASMHTLQEAQTLLARLRNMSTEGATLDSRPLQIRTNIDFACSQIEHYLEALHDRRRFLDGLSSARKHHLEQCLALCLLYQDLTEAVTALKQLRDEVSQRQGLGDSQSNAEILLHEHLKREEQAKELQDKCIHLLKTAEDMASKGHYAGLEARSRAYSVLEAATALHETCDTRTALLNQAILFFKLAQTALTKLDQAEVQVAGMGGEGAQRLSLVVGVVEEAVQPALTEGYAILEVTGGRSQPHNMGISQVVEELERRRAQLSSICVSNTEQVLQRTELSNAFLEQHNVIESWLVRIGDAFLQGHQDPGGSLSLARDFLHLHQTLNRDVTEKKGEIDSLAMFLENLLPDLSLEEGASYKDKMQALYDHWEALRKLCDGRIGISEKYVKFHEDAEAVNGEFESFELLLKEAKGEDDRDLVEAKWEQLQRHYLDLCNTGKTFCQAAKNVEDPYMDTNRAVLCVENVLEHLGKRRLVSTDLHSHFHMKLTTTKEMTMLFNTYKDNIRKMQKEMGEVEVSFCPLLRGDYGDPEGIGNTLEHRLNIYVSAVKKIQEDIQEMMTRAEVMSYKGDQPGQRDEVIGSLLQLHQNLQNKATEYQILGHMLIQWCRNIAEIHRSCDKLEGQFDMMSLDIGSVEAQLREHEASRQAVSELLKFAQNEADSIMSKIKDQCPTEAGARDIATMEEMLVRRGKEFDVVWTQHQHMMERQLKRSQYHVDLQVISDQLRELSEQLSRMRGHYGDSLAAATNMQAAFNQFQHTVDALEKRVQTFVSTTTKMLGPEDDSGEVKEDLAELGKKWSTFQMQVGQGKKSIELAIVFFKLVEEAEDWFKDGTELLVEVAGETVNIKNPEQAERLRSRIEHFLKPGEEAQQQRITHISCLALELYSDSDQLPKPVEVMSHQNTQIVESLTVIMRNLTLMVENLKAAEDLNETQKKEKEELAASLAAAQAEAEAARLATLAAEEARRAAEAAAAAMAIPIQPIVPERVEIEIQTEAIPLPMEEEPPKREESPPLKKAKMIDDEPQPMPPIFLTPLVGATVTEGVKFTFECRVLGMPMPEVEWLKDSRPVTDNPDYKTNYKEGLCSLTIEETFTEDSALFICRGVNGAGIAETSATLTVKEAEPVEVLSPPVFTRRLEDTTTQEGSSFQLEATVEGNPLPTVSWCKNGSSIDESPDYVITFNNGECVLRFEEVFLEDQAEYSCRATSGLGEDNTKALLTVTAVEVSERPKFTMPLSNVMARAGQKFKLECQVTGLPAPTVTWFHNNKPVKETPDCKIAFDGSVATLVMAEAFPKNAGMYTVVAKNSAGEGKTSANVSVKGRIPTETSDSEVTSDVDVEPVKPSVQLALKDTTVTEGQSGRLDCVIVGQPEPEVIWYHDDTPVKESNDFKLLFHGDRCSLVIREAYLEDAGIYRVVAVNSAGEASTACFLNVDPAPELPPPPPAPEQPTVVAPRFSLLPTDQHVVEGKPVTLRATVTGHPRPTVAWFRDVMPLLPDNDLQIHESSDGSLSMTIHSTSLDHTGQHEIVASNSAGTAKCVAYLSIEPRLPTPPPTDNMEPPVFTKLLTDTVVSAGNSVKFEAEVTGVPAPTVSDLDVSPLALSQTSGKSALPIVDDDTMVTACVSVSGTSDHRVENVIDRNGNDTSYIACQHTLNSESDILGMNNYLSMISKLKLNSVHLEMEESEPTDTKDGEQVTQDEKDSSYDKEFNENSKDSAEAITGDGGEFQVKEDHYECGEKHHNGKDKSCTKDEMGENCNDDKDDLSKFHSMKVLDMETYSRMMMENVVVYGSLDDASSTEATAFDQFEKYNEINVLPSADYSNLFVSDEPKNEIINDQVEDKEEEFDVYSETEEGIVHTAQEKPSQFIDLGLSEEMQPVKLADLWNLIKDKLLHPKASDASSNVDTCHHQSEDNKDKSVALCAEGDRDSGYFSSNFSPTTPCSGSSVGSPQSGTSKRNSFTLPSEDISRCNSPGEDYLLTSSVVSKSCGSEKIAESGSNEKTNIPSSSGQISSKVCPKEKNEKPRYNDPIISEGVKSLGESMKFCGKDLKPIEECSPDSDESIDEKPNFKMIQNQQNEDTFTSKSEMSLQTDGKDNMCLNNKEDEDTRDLPCTLTQTCLDPEEQKNKIPNDKTEVTVRRFLVPECEFVSEYLRCPSSLSVISEESYVSDYEENSQISNDSNNNEDWTSKHSKTDTVSESSVGEQDPGSQPVSGEKEPVANDDDDDYERERKARRAARLAKLRELTQRLQNPSKISQTQATHTESLEVHLSNSSVVSRVTLDTQVNSLFNLGNLLERDDHQHPEEYGDPKHPSNATVFVIKSVGQLSKMEIRHIINEKMQAAVGAGRALIRAFVLPFSEAMFIDLSNPERVQEAAGSPVVDYGRSVVFETCLHATRGQGLAFDGENLDQDIPFLVTWTLNDCPITGQEYQRGHLQYVHGGTGNRHTLDVPVTSMMQAGRVAIIAENTVGKAVSAAALRVIESRVVQGGDPRKT